MLQQLTHLRLFELPTGFRLASWRKMQSARQTPRTNMSEIKVAVVVSVAVTFLELQGTAHKRKTNTEEEFTALRYD